MKKTHFRKHPKTQNKPTESIKLAAKKRKKKKKRKGSQEVSPICNPKIQYLQIGLWKYESLFSFFFLYKPQGRKRENVEGGEIKISRI